MHKETPIDQASSRWSNKVLLGIFLSALLGSNILNSYINTQYHHGIKIEENEQASRRRQTHIVEKQDFKNQIQWLKHELEICKNK